jgi:plasmid stabilization system protein ParE
VRVVYTPRVRRDIDKIRQYIAGKSGSPEVADRFLIRLIKSCDTLAYSTKAYPVYRFDSTRRMMPFENYLILYQFHGDEIEIVHVRHAARGVSRG